ncbi:MAG: hypothetical protein WBB74_12845 [Gaiellaceae bacterium]
MASAVPPAEGTPLQTGTVEPAAEPAQSAAEPQPGPPVEAQLVRLGLLTVAQLAEANRERFESGRSVLEIVLERGWLSRRDLEVLFGDSLPAPATEVEAPAPEPEPEPQPAPELPPAATASKRFHVAIHLIDGDYVEVDAAGDEAAAQARGRQIVTELSQPRDGDWPLYGGRFIKPEAIVSVDIVEEELG